MQQTLRTAALALCLILAGCGEASVRLRGLTPLNVNENNESTPVDVRVFALRSDARFRAAAFEQLWSDPKAALGGDLAADPVQAPVLPGGQDAPVRVVAVPLGGDVAWIGVMVLSRRSDGQPRTLVLKRDDADRDVIEVVGCGLRLEGRPVDGTVSTAPAKQAADPVPEPVRRGGR